MSKSFRETIIIKTLFLTLWGILPFSESDAQIVPPDFICVENDTLRWTVPINNCGPFVSYDIYFSSDIDGPYSLLANVTDPNQDFYFHMNANSANNVWYYYILSNHNCPGESPFPSDTLDNRDPDFPLLDAVTVTNGQIELFWTPSIAPETSGYIIYRRAANGNFVPIENVFPETVNYYLDMTATPDIGSEEYTIVAVDDCGNTSIFNTEPQSSIYLQTQINACTQSAILNWNLYENWPEGIENHEILVSTNGSPFVTVDTIAPTDTLYVYDELNDGFDYCFKVKANRANNDFFSVSNENCLTASIVQPNRNLVLQTVSFTPDDRIILVWRWDTNAEIQTVNILNSSSNSGYTAIDSQTPLLPLSPTDTFYVDSHMGNQGKEFFKIHTIDDCDTSSYSNYGATIFLSGNANPDLTNTLEWTPFDFENGNVLEYRLYKKTTVDEYLLDVTPSNTLEYVDLENGLNIYDADACYFVEAYGVVELGDGNIVYTLSRSNTVCLVHSSPIRFPNAFAPNGKNNIFKPAVAFPNLIEEYQLSIFDRWGKRMFQTTSPEEGWDGEFKGKRMKAGVYVFRMEATQTDGQKLEESGTLMLLR